MAETSSSGLFISDFRFRFVLYGTLPQATYTYMLHKYVILLLLRGLPVLYWQIVQNRTNPNLTWPEPEAACNKIAQTSSALVDKLLPVIVLSATCTVGTVCDFELCFCVLLVLGVTALKKISFSNSIAIHLHAYTSKHQIIILQAPLLFWWFKNNSWIIGMRSEKQFYQSEKHNATAHGTIITGIV